MTDQPEVASSARRDLPDFTRPPVAEVALGLMFQPLQVGAVTLARLYDRWRSDYPQFEEHPALPPSPVPGLVIETGTPPIRLWLQNEQGDRLVQVQRDRIVVNWRKTDPSQDYPRYKSLIAELRKRLTDLREFFVQAAVGDVEPAAVEVTYVNVVLIQEPEPMQLSEILRIYDSPPQSLGTPVDQALSVRFDLSERFGAPSTLAVTAQHSPFAEQQAAILQLSCQIQSATLDEAFAGLDKGHEHVVRSFRDITTSEMHEKWGLQG